MFHATIFLAVVSSLSVILCSIATITSLYLFSLLLLRGMFVMCFAYLHCFSSLCMSCTLVSFSFGSGRCAGVMVSFWALEVFGVKMVTCEGIERFEGVYFLSM